MRLEGERAPQPFARTDHRPWPLPAGRWWGRQTWNDLLFAHWQVPAATLRPFVPPGVRLEEEAGRAWLGVVPFTMTGVRARGMPSVPWLSAFPELNVRIYVERDGKPGVWFLSLDASRALAVWAARRFFHLPYRHARMRVRRAGADVTYASQLHAGETARFRGTYGPAGPVVEARPGTLERSLTERYCLYAQAPDGSLWRTQIQHVPWPLQAAHAEIDATDLLASHGLHVDGPPQLLHFARKIHVAGWLPERVG